MPRARSSITSSCPARASATAAGRHELPSLRLAAANGYRVPVGAKALKRTLERLRPDVVLLHDPFWAPLRVTEAAHALGAKVVAVHHGSAALDAAGLRGPSRGWEALFRAWLRHAYAPVDAIASVVDPEPDCGRVASFPLRLGLHDAFRPQPARAATTSSTSGAWHGRRSPRSSTTCGPSRHEAHRLPSPWPSTTSSPRPSSAAR